jgi:hypothetical protein
LTRDEALDVVSMISSHWPGNQWSAQSLDAYARAIEGWDADLTMKAVTRAVQEMEFYPRVSVLKDFYGIEKRNSETTSIQKQLDNIPSQIMPPWVRGYVVSRVRHKDMRIWPEQINQDLDEALMPKDAQEAYIAEAEGLPIDALFRQITLGEA